MEYGNALLTLLSYLRRIFGLQVLHLSENGSAEIRNSQRFLAVFWLTSYVLSLFMTDKMTSDLGFSLKNSLVTYVLPKIFLFLLVLNTILTFVLTHIFASDTKCMAEEIVSVYQQYDCGRIKFQSKGTHFAGIIVLIQMLYGSHWYVMIQQIDNFTFYDVVAIMLPKIVSALFVMEYISAVVFLTQQFARVNMMLQGLLDDSLKCRQYPLNERKFQENIMGIADQHKVLSQAGARMNKTFSLQLLMNFGLMYAYVIVNSYVALYSILSMFNTPIPTQLIVQSVANVIVNSGTLLILVETTTQLYQEVIDVSLLQEQTLIFLQFEDSTLILLGIHMSSNKEHAINTVREFDFDKVKYEDIFHFRSLLVVSEWPKTSLKYGCVDCLRWIIPSCSR